MDSLNQLEEKVMLAVQKIGLLKDKNSRLRSALEQAQVSIKSIEAEKARLSSEIQKVQGLRDENEALKRDREDFRERVERIIEKVEVLSDIVVEDETPEDAEAADSGTKDDRIESNTDNESEVAMPLYGGEDNQP